MNLTAPAPPLADHFVRLRPWRLDDLPCVREAGEDTAITEATTVPSDYTPQVGRAFIERQWTRSREGQGWSLAITSVSDDLARGCVALLLRPQPGVAGLGYWLTPSARGAGYASHAVALLTDWALSAAGLHRVEAWVEPGNVSSLRLLTKCGYLPEGRLRSFLVFPTRRSDALVFSRVTADPRSTPGGSPPMTAG
ncbi:MAG: GNAT family N-acetyltransferase [Kineosporiaceae bacterium]|nr:GNAT family N-acetyltransferase [Kineosporiaceae bacterium]